jgi:hypothetical protein
MEGKCLIIVGMHRSGTSLTTSILQKAGLNIGSELLEAGEGNVKGHFENCNFYDFHKRGLHSLSMNSDGWDLKRIDKLDKQLDKEASAIIKKNSNGSWGWKDPRTTLFLRFWEKKLPEAKYLFIYRNPWEVVDSLYRRNNDVAIIQDPWNAFKAWNFYNREIIEMYKKHMHNSLLIQIDDIISNTSAFIQKINHQLGFNLQAEKTKDIFDKSIYGTSVQQNCLKSAQTAFVFPEAIDTLNELRVLTNKDEFEINKSLLRDSIVSDWQEGKAKNAFANKLSLEIDSVNKEREQLKAKIAHCENKILSVKMENQELKTEVEHYKNELFWMKKTKIWKTRNILFEIKTWLHKSLALNFRVRL